MFKVGGFMLPDEVGGRSGKTQLSAVDDRHAAAHFRDIMQGMGCHHHCPPAGVLGLEFALEQGARFRIKSAGRLIKNVHILAGQQAGGQPSFCVMPLE